MVQDQGAWVVDYRLRHTGAAGVVIAPDEIAVKVESWVSNSRVASHAVPRPSSLAISHGPEFTAIGDVIAAADEAHRCREKLIVRVWGEDQCPCRAGSCGRASDKVKAKDAGRANGKDKQKEKSAGAAHEPVPGPAGPTAGLPMSLAPGGIVHVRLRLEHQHVLFGDYDPLLGVRAVEITLAGATVRDRVPLDREQYLAQPRFSWPEPPEERRDTRHSVTGPDSLHLEAHVPGHHYYRYPDRPVRYSTPMRLRFSYLIAAGTEGECRVRVAQYKDTPTSWRMLNDAGFEKCLKTVGRWTRGRARLHHPCRGDHAGAGFSHRRRHRHRRDVDRRRQPRAGDMPGACGAVISPRGHRVRIREARLRPSRFARRLALSREFRDCVSCVGDSGASRAIPRCPGSRAGVCRP